ncbi:GtrA family protein [Bradyrhizobium sp.]|jgi:putative flippase GtrA|uniref:GtrA family protein n=1 Tax=Bradyrhizobium sp. TaxID=376 RepID=UPI003C1F415E
MNLILRKIANAWYQRTLLAKLFSFASIGLINVAVDVSIFTIAFRFLGLLIVSNIISWLVAVTGSYVMNTKITFGRETGGALSIGRYLRFVASGIAGVTVTTSVLVLVAPYTNIPIAKLASIIAGFGVNFCMSHFIVFRSLQIDAAKT